MNYPAGKVALFFGLFFFFSVLPSAGQIARGYEFDASVGTHLRVDTSVGYGGLGATFGLGLSPRLRSQFGIVLDAQVLLESASTGLRVSPFISDFHYRVVFRGTPSQGVEQQVQPDRVASSVSTLSVGRVSSTDPLGFFDSFVVDGLRFVLGSERVELDLSIGYQGLLINETTANTFAKKLEFLDSPDEENPDTLPPLDLWSTDPPEWAVFVPGASLLVSSARLIFPELVGRQNLFLNLGYSQSIPSQIYHSYGLAGSTGPLSPQTFYTLGLGLSYLQSPGLSNSRETGFGLLGNIRTYLPGNKAPRIGLTGFASTPYFVIPIGLQVTPEFLPILESAAWFTSLDIESVLYRSPQTARLGMSWNGSVFAGGKTAEGPGLSYDQGLVDFSGPYVFGGNLGARYRPLRDVLLTLDLGGLIPWATNLGDPYGQVSFAIEVSY